MVAMATIGSFDFDCVWRYASLHGKCDAIDGMEYKRVKQEWIDAGRPSDLIPFIVRQANVGPLPIKLVVKRLARSLGIG